ncbi:2131_t:CDS:2, partial [Rhizophagus irregularis]
RLLDFTSKKLNEILESENSQAYRASHSDLNYCVINDLRSLDKNTSKKLNESLESEDSHATSLKANEVLVSEDMSDYII